MDILNLPSGLTLENRVIAHPTYGEVMRIAALVQTDDERPRRNDAASFLLRASSHVITGPTQPRLIKNNEALQLTVAMDVRWVPGLERVTRAPECVGERATIHAQYPSDLGVTEAAYMVGGKPQRIFGTKHDQLAVVTLCPWLQQLAKDMGAEYLEYRTTDDIDPHAWIRMDVSLHGLMDVLGPEEQPVMVFDRLVTTIAALWSENNSLTRSD